MVKQKRTAQGLHRLTPRPTYYQADNRLTHRAMVKIYNPDCVRAYTRAQRAHCAGGVGEECIHGLDEMTGVFE